MSTNDLFLTPPNDLPMASCADASDSATVGEDDRDVVVRSQPEIEVYPNRYGFITLKMHEDGAYSEEQFVYIHPLFVDAVIAAMLRVKAQVLSGE